MQRVTNILNLIYFGMDLLVREVGESEIVESYILPGIINIRISSKDGSDNL